MRRRTITQGAVNITYKNSYFCNQIWFLWFLFGSQSWQLISFKSPKAYQRIKCIVIIFVKQKNKVTINKISKTDGNHTVATNVVFFITRVILGKNNIAYLGNLCNELENLDRIKKQYLTEKRLSFKRKNITIRCYTMMVAYISWWILAKINLKTMTVLTSSRRWRFTIIDQFTKTSFWCNSAPSTFYLLLVVQIVTNIHS